jgi:hypothetical protein
MFKVPGILAVVEIDNRLLFVFYSAWAELAQDRDEGLLIRESCPGAAQLHFSFIGIKLNTVSR